MKAGQRQKILRRNVWQKRLFEVFVFDRLPYGSTYSVWRHFSIFSYISAVSVPELISTSAEYFASCTSDDDRTKTLSVHCKPLHIEILSRQKHLHEMFFHNISREVLTLHRFSHGIGLTVYSTLNWSPLINYLIFYTLQWSYRVRRRTWDFHVFAVVGVHSEYLMSNSLSCVSRSKGPFKIDREF